MKGLLMLTGLLWGYIGLAQPLPKPVDSLRNQDNMPVVPSQGSRSMMPVLKDKGSALPMPNGYVPQSGREEYDKAVDALRGQFDRFSRDSVPRREQRTPPAIPKKERP